MRRYRPLIAVALLVFLIVAITRLPARWAIAALPKAVRCTNPAGTLWNGRCEQLVLPAAGTLSLQWHLHPAQLLRGHLAADVAASSPAGTATGVVAMSAGGRTELADVQADVQLDPALTGRALRGASGRVRASLPRLVLRGRTVEAIQGHLEIRQLVQSIAGPPLALGDFAVDFPASAQGEPVGQIRDLGGPVALEGTVRLTREPGYVVDGRIGTRSGAPAGLDQQLQILGPADAQGRRPFSVAGTY